MWEGQTFSCAKAVQVGTIWFKAESAGIMQYDEKTLLRCVREIEDRLGWGDSCHWTNSDFEALSERLLDETGLLLSVTTLKRVWGKVTYNSRPHANTLNALAQFLGHESWRAYSQQTAKTENTGAEEPAAVTEKRVPDSPGLRKTVAGMSVVALAAGLFMVLSTSKKINPDDYGFSSAATAAAGVPNSVVFQYDAAKAPTDSVQIQQTWDAKRRTKVSKHNTRHTAIYYYPGYFRAKLVVSGQIVKEHDLFVGSDGWVAAIDKAPVPVYLAPHDFLKDGVVRIGPDLIAAQGVAMQPETPELRLFNVRPMPGLMNDGFVFQTSVKNGFSAGAAACQKIEVLVLCKNDVIIVPLVSKRCVGDIYILVAGNEIGSAEADLSGFGTNTAEWTSLRLESRDRQVRFFVNGTEVYAAGLKNPPSEIVGVQYRFEGAGAVRECSFANAGHTFALMPPQP